MQLENQLRTEIEFLQDFIEEQDVYDNPGAVEVLMFNKSQAEIELAMLLNEDDPVLN